MLDDRRLAEFPVEEFTGRQPFPWFDFERLLRPEAFEALLRDFPPLERFEKHVGLPRIHGQRPHDRYYLAYEHSVYGSGENGAAEIRHEELAPSWQTFVRELEGSEYRAFVTRLLGRGDLEQRYAWHVGFRGSEVSPHQDSIRKAGTHLFYFNTRDDWDEAWGGQTLVLSGKHVDELNPDFGDFEASTANTIVDNHSFLFKNTPDAWHGVRTLTCPEDAFRRLFTVVFELPQQAELPEPQPSGGLLARVRDRAAAALRR